MARFLVLALFVVACAHDKRSPQPPKAAEVLPAEPEPDPYRLPPPLPAPEFAEQEKGPTAHMSLTAARIASLDEFAIGPVGFSGNTSLGEKLTRKLITEPDAIAMLDELAASPNRVAQLYAYWALQQVDVSRAEALRERLVHDTTPVEVMRGCLGSAKPANTIVADLDALPKP